MSEGTFEFNVKCIIFGGVLVMLYWVVSTSGKTNYWLFPLIFIVAYVFLAWYDKLYKCTSKLTFN